MVETSALFPPLRRQGLRTLQLNLGYRCNQSCTHCHVNAGPTRTEQMDDALLELIPEVIRLQKVVCVDLTGGAPELHPRFRTLVQQLRSLGIEVIDRCNLTILSEPGQEDLAEFLAAHGVTVVASLPCYSADNVDQQRGKGVFERSIQGLLQLNRLGYGSEDGRLPLHLVFNPQRAVLPPPQAQLEQNYKQELAHQGIRFNRLLTLVNMPIQRYARGLEQRGELASYQKLLEHSHDPANLASVMCRQLISVDWQGHLYDCDFNQQLGLTMPMRHLRELAESALDLEGLPIRTDRHCFGCTAGAGSSCSGALQS